MIEGNESILHIIPMGKSSKINHCRIKKIYPGPYKLKIWRFPKTGLSPNHPFKFIHFPFSGKNINKPSSYWGTPHDELEAPVTHPVPCPFRRPSSHDSHGFGRTLQRIAWPWTNHPMLGETEKLWKKRNIKFPEVIYPNVIQFLASERDAGTLFCRFFYVDESCISNPLRLSGLSRRKPSNSECAPSGSLRSLRCAQKPATPRGVREKKQSWGEMRPSSTKIDVPRNNGKYSNRHKLGQLSCASIDYLIRSLEEALLFLRYLYLSTGYTNCLIRQLSVGFPSILDNSWFSLTKKSWIHILPWIHELGKHQYVYLLPSFIHEIKTGHDRPGLDFEMEQRRPKCIWSLYLWGGLTNET